MGFGAFLVKAKKNTYATNGESKEKILGDGSKELTYEEGQYKYRDRYFGHNPFAGEEVVWKSGEFIWVMNYYGKVDFKAILSLRITEKEVYIFLKNAMKQVTEERPFRGPKDFQDENFHYTDKSEGNVDNFIGTERIFYKGKEIYRLYYHGGLVKKK